MTEGIGGRSFSSIAAPLPETPRRTEMAYAGQTIENPVSGERITFLQTAADTDGALPGAHIHPQQEERFEVVEGTMAFRLGLKRIVAGPGEVVTVPAGRVHTFKNAGDETAKVRVQVRPALAMEGLFETTVALAEDGRTTGKGMPKPLDLALFVRRYQREVKAPFPPAPVVRAMLAPLAWMATRKGHGERYAPAGRELAVAL